MKNLNLKLVSYLKNQNHINPNPCQELVASKVTKLIEGNAKPRIFKLNSNLKLGIYIFGSVGVGKSVIIKALNVVYPNSEMLQFNDLIFNLQSKNKSNKEYLDKIKKKKLILIDEFFIDDMTNLILFKKFLDDIKNENIPIVMSGNKEFNIVYHDTVNTTLCNKIKKQYEDFFLTVKIKSKIDYRLNDKVNHSFFFIKEKNNYHKQNLIIQQLSSKVLHKELFFKRRGNSFSIKKGYGNLVDIKFEKFFTRNLVFQDYELMAKKVKIFVIRDIKQMDENSKNLLTRFISFIDVVYENNNILSISTNVELDKLYVGKTNFHEFKRTKSRLIEMGSNKYINKNLKKLFTKN